MEVGEVYQMVKAEIVALGVDEELISRSRPLSDLPDWDSLDSAELAMRLEKEAGVVIEDSDIENWVLINDVVMTVKQKCDEWE